MQTREKKKNFISVTIKDRYARIILSIVAAHVMTNYDVPESFFTAIFKEDYIRSFLASLLISSIVVEYIHRVSAWLDSRHSWLYQSLNRLCWQLIMGFTIPSFAVFILVTAYFAFFGLNILTSGYLYEDYIIALLMIISINLYYFGLTCYLHYKHLHDYVQQGDMSPGETVDSIQVINGAENILLSVHEIAQAYIINGQLLIQDQAGRQHLTTGYALDDLEKILDGASFFRINRQLLVARSEIESYEDASYGKISVKLNGKSPVPSVISQRKAPQFRKWLNMQLHSAMWSTAGELTK